MAGRSFVAVGLVLATALAVAWASHGPAQATTFNPFLAPTDSYRLDPTTPSVASDVRAQFNIFPPSSNFSPLGHITFADSEVFVADAAGIPNTGAYVGQVAVIAALGLANGGCGEGGSTVPIWFGLVDASTDTSARSITNTTIMTLSGGLGAGDTTLVYAHPLDPMGVRPDGLPVNEIEIDSEQMLISGVDTTTNTYTVVRGWNGTAPAVHLAGIEIKRVNVIYPAGPDWNLLVNLAQDDGDLDNNGVAEFSEYINQVADGADAVPSFVRDSLDPNANADDGGAIAARARYAGVMWVAGTQLTVFQIVTGEPGALSVLPNLGWATTAWGYPQISFWQDPLGPPSNNALSDFCNFSSNTLLFGVPHDNSCTSPSPPPGILCRPIGGGFTLQLADDGGCPGTSMPNECGNQDGGPPEVVRQVNPASPQALRVYKYVVSQRDYDNDGHENMLDTCHSDPNPGWDPREFNFQSGDADADGLPTPCDPNDTPAGAEESGAQCDNALDDDGDGRVNDGCPASGGSETGAQCNNALDDDSDGLVNDGCPATSFNADQDADGWQNRLDSCPTSADAAPGGGAGITPNTFMWDQDVPGLVAPDGGPHRDDIAPACDVAGESCAGCPALTPTGANGHYHATAAAQTICIGTATDDCSATLDADADGVTNAIDTCRDGANAPLRFPDAAPPGGSERGADVMTVQNDADTITVADATGFTVGSPIVIDSPLETLRYITSIIGNTINFQPAIAPASHGAGDPVAQVSFAQSMRDLNNDGFTDVGDIALLTGVFGSRGGDPANDGVGDSGVPGYQGRYDLNYDSFVDTGDIGLLTGVFGATCGPPP